MFSLTRNFSRLGGSIGLATSRSYITRAHPKPIPEFPVPDAVKFVLNDIGVRHQKRKRKEYRATKLQPPPPVEALDDNKNNQTDEGDASSSTKSKPKNKPRKFGYPDETIELALNLNLDPRKPGQSLRGSVSLPHGTGKKGVNCVVFTSDEAAQEQAKAAGALHVGSEALIDSIVSGDIPVDSFQAALATQEMVPSLSKKAARLLGPRGLMPNAKVGTLLKTTPELLKAVENAVAGKEVSFRTEKQGIVHVGVGKASFGQQKLLENIGAVMEMIFEAKPESYGKGKKKSSGKKGQAQKNKQPAYLLKAHLCSTQSPAIRIDIRTVDPNSAFFLTGLDPAQANAGTPKEGAAVEMEAAAA